MRKIILWGATGQAIVLEEFLPLIGYDIVALFDNDVNVKSISDEIPIYYGVRGFQEWKSQNKNQDIYFIVAIGGDKGKDRLSIHDYLKHEGYKSVTAIHPNSYVAKTAKIGNGCQILVNATVGARGSLGKECIVNTAACIDHECNIGNGVHISTGANLAGCVTIGHYSFIGAGAVILPRIKIGIGATIAAGAVVTRDVSDYTTVCGIPAKPIKGKL